MARSKSPTPSFFHPQPSEAEAAFRSLQPEIEALRAPLRPQVDVQRASAVAYSVAMRDREADRRAWFQRLAAVELYDLALAERVGRLAQATWFARQRQLGQLALASAATVSPELLRDAQQRRRTMLKVLEHWFDDDAALTAELAAIREGAGHQDLANDLDALADLYQRPAVRVVIAEDRKHYDEHDATSARSLARAIFTSLGLARDSDAQRWAALCSRAWTLLVESYDRHRKAGVFLFEASEDVGETYPSLVTAARRSAGRGVGRDEGGAVGEGGAGDLPQAPEAA